MSNPHGAKWIRPRRRAAIYARDGHACVYCGATTRLGLDHLLPRELGGGHESRNLVTACHPCNSSRQDHPLWAWLRILLARGADLAAVRRRIRRARRCRL